MDKEQLQEGLHDIINTVKYGVVMFLLIALAAAAIIIPCVMAVVKFCAFWRVAFGN